MISTENKKDTLFKIKQLIEKTGVTRETIHFYLTEGLLQEPTQKSRNMSWYSQEHIDRLNIIKELQDKQFLPLKAIKSILNNSTNDFDFTTDQQKLIESVKSNILNNKIQSYSLQMISEETGVSQDIINQMIDIGYINPITDGFVNLEDKNLIENWMKLEKLGINNKTGFQVKDLEMFTDIVEILFSQEFQKITGKLNNLSGNQIVDIIENSVPVINDIISNLHQKKVKQFINGFKPNI